MEEVLGADWATVSEELWKQRCSPRPKNAWSEREEKLLCKLVEEEGSRVADWEEGRALRRQDGEHAEAQVVRGPARACAAPRGWAAKRQRRVGPVQ